MIVTHIIGGLGNQMFQYAVGRALAIKNGQQLYLDTSDFVDYKLHPLELARVFKGPFDTATSVQRLELLGWRAGQHMQKLLRRPQFAALRGGRMVVEPHFHYWPEFNWLPGDRYLVGYWQSEKYFKQIESIIRTDFSFRQPLSKRNKQIADEITSRNAISLHVRRGNYMQNTKTYSACSLNYYREAIRHIVARVEQPRFFVFSDDITWVKDNLKIDSSCQYVDHNQGSENYNDMRLMSLCKHHIIANSSFSWWGAWLNQNKDKIVIYPKKWFNDSSKNISDLTPETWIPINE
jgi:hypothetical protein